MMRLLKQFSNKVVIVTGGGSGIGKALCTELGMSGAAVVVADINEKNAVKPPT
jgi:NAD(P)-dependent dehydrogenase (short-subunit alcohol dehydrogenase family)